MLPTNSAILLFAACACALIAGCKEQRSFKLTASAAAEASPNGAITTRAPTSKELASLKNDIAKREAIDERYPGSQAPRGLQSKRVVAVSVPGILQLSDGRRIRLDGIRCDEEAVGYLRRVLQAKDVTVAVLPSSSSYANLIPAEVWVVEGSSQLQRITGPSYSNINETAITSQWCKVEATPTNSHNARYAALAKAFHD
jgi:hypothetical protein